MPHIINIDQPAPSGLSIRGVLHQPESPNGDAIVLTHGAGANCHSPLLIALADAFCSAGLTVLRCDLPFRQLRPHGPPPRGSAERDQQGLRDAVEFLRAQNPARIFLGGHSYGGRQATMLASTAPDLVRALVLFSYPLHPPMKRTELRTSHFPTLHTPALFFHGTRDGFGTIEELTEALKLIPAPTALHPVPSAGHELLTARNRSELPTTVVTQFQSFIDTLR